jgi:hypothetical protein
MWYSKTSFVVTTCFLKICDPIKSLSNTVVKCSEMKCLVYTKVSGCIKPIFLSDVSYLSAGS